MGLDRSRQAGWETADPEYKEYIDNRPEMRRLLKGSVDEMRVRAAALKKAANKPFNSDGVHIHDKEISSDSGNLISVRTYRPDDLAEGTIMPAVVVYHGGGWVIGDLTSEQQTAVDLARHFRCLVLNVDYRRAPESPYPAAVKDAWFAFSWLVENAKKLSVDPNKIILYGNSAGANLAAVVAQYAKTTDKKVMGQILRVPATCYEHVQPKEYTNESMTKFKNAPILDKAAMENFLSLYAKGEDPSDEKLSPLLGDQTGLGPVYIQVGGMDPLRDQGIAYYEKCKSSGVDATIDVYNGVPHGFLILPFGKTASANKDMYAWLEKIWA